MGDLAYVALNDGLHGLKHLGGGCRVGLHGFDAPDDCNTPYTTHSGMLGGMLADVCAGLAHPRWHESSHIVVLLSTDRILMVDVCNPDPASVGVPGATIEL